MRKALVLFFVVGLVACGSKSVTQPQTQQPQTPASTYQAGWTTDFINQGVEDCSTGSSNPLDTPQACQCYMNKIANKYTFNAYGQIQPNTPDEVTIEGFLTSCEQNPNQ